jgi:voltage-gated potassium channel
MKTHMENPQVHTAEKLTIFQLVLLVLSVVVIVALVADAVTPIRREVSTILQALDYIACALFFIDFTIRLRRAESKTAFMRWGWIDLLACIPNIDVLRVGRMVRVLRIVRLLRGVRVGHRIISLILQNRAKSAFASILLTSILLITVSSVAILIAEDEPSGNIKTAEDAVWWSVTTMTTVGYGDKYPTTTEGRIVAMALMFSGVGLFGTISGLVASFFLGQRNAGSPELKEILARLEAIDTKMEKQQSGTPAS